MPDFKRWDVIKIPHPYGEAPARHHRPALVLAAGDLQIAHGLLWIMMITTAPNFRWPGDVDITDHEAAGLPVASVIRTAKLTTIEGQNCARIGSLPAPERKIVAEKLLATLG
jgi:mRNA interferase MazF